MIRDPPRADIFEHVYGITEIVFKYRNGDGVENGSKPFLACPQGFIRAFPSGDILHRHVACPENTDSPKSYPMIFDDLSIDGFCSRFYLNTFLAFEIGDGHLVPDIPPPMKNLTVQISSPFLLGKSP